MKFFSEIYRRNKRFAFAFDTARERAEFNLRYCAIPCTRARAEKVAARVGVNYAARTVRGWMFARLADAPRVAHIKYLRALHVSKSRTVSALYIPARDAVKPRARFDYVELITCCFVCVSLIVGGVL